MFYYCLSIIIYYLTAIIQKNRLNMFFSPRVASRGEKTVCQIDRNKIRMEIGE